MPDPLELFSSIALYNPAAVAEEQTDEMQVDTPPLPQNSETIAEIISLREFFVSIRILSFEEKLKKLNELALNYIAGFVKFNDLNNLNDSKLGSLYAFIFANNSPVSYTHLDVYKRQTVSVSRP